MEDVDTQACLTSERFFPNAIAQLNSLFYIYSLLLISFLFFLGGGHQFGWGPALIFVWEGGAIPIHQITLLF